MNNTQPTQSEEKWEAKLARRFYYYIDSREYWLWRADVYHNHKFDHFISALDEATCNERAQQITNALNRTQLADLRQKLGESEAKAAWVDKWGNALDDAIMAFDFHGDSECLYELRAILQKGKSFGSTSHRSV